ncbi:MAG: preprotein translocase subunit SecG [Deltaproteobacteria bacterium]|nr:preprotein translocase subunit SecG [Deltaproteobacteria bacterium]
MTAVIIAVHTLVCVSLILIVLLQTGKGADMGAAFGGGSSQTVFGSTGATTFLTKATTVAAVVFMLTSLTLTYIGGHRKSTSVMESAPPAAQTEQAPAPAAPVQADQGPEQR